jgi:hypothetical protein
MQCPAKFRSNRKSSLITERLGENLAHKYGLQSEHAGIYSVLFRIPTLSTRSENRQRQEDQISTMRFHLAIIVILSSTRALHLDPTTDTTCRLSENSLHIGQIRSVQMIKNYMRFGRESMPDSLISVWLKRLIQDMCHHIRRH